ncbi:MAG: toll/interleukin-1 receptor domain-containing protein [Xanthobacteraceae bacterium]|nr:toll/interleukin-1 receptor domain-containing protein [Xanthobacteraceae bacterium]
MPRKIFISYRREDSGANALGIGQYLEHEFGRKNVFIDVDMRAGAKFPTVLVQRLAECKVMLVLIGPDWLAAKDDQGRRRLDDPGDWVRLEISHALSRDIAVIPVRLNGAELPPKAALPDDIRGLLDHQAVSVTLAGFRNEMAGLVRDIRAIPDPWPWRRAGAIAAGFLLLFLLGVWAFVQPGAIERVRQLVASLPTGGTSPEVWSGRGRPGEWVLYGTIGQGPALSHYFQPASIRFFGDRVAYRARYALLASVTENKKANSQGDYEDVTNVIDCKNSTTAMADRTVYSSAGAVISQSKWGTPEFLDLAIGQAIPPGSMLAIGQYIMCSEDMRTPLLSKQNLVKNMKYLVRTSAGNGDIFHGATKAISDPTYPIELVTAIRFDADRPFTELFQGTVVGLPRNYRTRADRLQLNCADKKIQDVKFEFYDADDHWLSLTTPIPVQPIDVVPGTPFEALLNVACAKREKN